MSSIDSFKDIIVKISDFEINDDYILKVVNNNQYNKIIIDYYKRLFKEENLYKKLDLMNLTKKQLSGTYYDKIDSLINCNKFWTVDTYDVSQIRDFLRTSLCHDKFCNNCKKVKQACRMSKYIPEVEQYKEILYHMTLTVPNVPGIELKNTIDKMAKCFKTLIRYFTENLKIKGFDFKKYGYLGAIRSLEITFKEDSYHPHYHAALAFKNLNLEKTIENQYSYDYLGYRDTRYFSEFEILIQKIWYLLMNDITVNKINIDNLKVGYSCMIEKFEDNDYAELFKYMTKETDEKDNILTYENFKTLYFATYRIKQIQGYGVFYRITDTDIKEEVDKLYVDITSFLKSDNFNTRIEHHEPLSLLFDKNYTLISRKKIFQYLREIK